MKGTGRASERLRRCQLRVRSLGPCWRPFRRLPPHIVSPLVCQIFRCLLLTHCGLRAFDRKRRFREERNKLLFVRRLPGRFTRVHRIACFVPVLCFQPFLACPSLFNTSRPRSAQQPPVVYPRFGLRRFSSPLVAKPKQEKDLETLHGGKYIDIFSNENQVELFFFQILSTFSKSLI